MLATVTGLLAQRPFQTLSPNPSPVTNILAQFALQKSIEGRWVNRCQTGEFPVKFNSLLQRPLNPMRPGFDDIAEL